MRATGPTATTGGPREARLNAFAAVPRPTIDGLGIHFIHVRSPNADALPLVITHGWPGSIVEFHKVIGPLTDPTATAATPADAFHVVCPSLPGYGFSDKPAATGLERRADRRRLGRADGRASATTATARRAATGARRSRPRIGAAATPSTCVGIHLNMPSRRPDPATIDDLTERGAGGARRARRTTTSGSSGYSTQQSTRPQTLGYGLADSPAGQAAWILEKFWAWTDCDGHPENVAHARRAARQRDALLAARRPAHRRPGCTGRASATRRARDTDRRADRAARSSRRRSSAPSRRWAERRFTDIRYWNELDAGGHFAAFEQPELFVDDLRAFFRLVR